MTNNIIDRRENPRGKSLGNRQKFIKRSKEQIRKSVRDSLNDRTVGGTDDGHDVVIDRKDISEPQFSHKKSTGDNDMVLPGNKDFTPGDTLPKPSGGQGSGSGPGEASEDGQGDDDFSFALNNDEFIDILFEDLELPNMIPKANKAVEKFEYARAGYTNDGNPAQLNLEKSMIGSIGRRIALRTPKLRKIKDLEAELTKCNDDNCKLEIEEEIRSLRIRSKAVAFIDPIDLQYNNFTKRPKPSSKAVVFFVMDVSASMGEFHKTLAKRFFMLLNLLIRRRYDKVECVFIRHHTEAKECDEEEFFHSTENGGTKISSAFILAKEIMAKRYSPSEWNIYFSQASDGDNWGMDNNILFPLLEKDILPYVQYFSYIQVNEERNGSLFSYGSANLIDKYDSLSENHPNITTETITNVNQIYPTFRDIFKKRNIE